jgi:DNA-binding transcriptional LysR family regulator
MMTGIAATQMIARPALSPSSPAPSARRYTALGLDRGARPSKSGDRAANAHLRCSSDNVRRIGIVRIDSLTAQKRLVEAGFGLALLPESSIQEELQLGTIALIDVPTLGEREKHTGFDTADITALSHLYRGDRSMVRRNLWANLSDFRFPGVAGR